MKHSGLNKKGEDFESSPFLLFFQPGSTLKDISSKLILKLATIVAFSGFGLVLLTILVNALFSISNPTKSLLLVSGFALMLLGTLWKVVLEMNQED
ncbi:MAG: hypothetical protein HEP71_17915 [Roseivirga sp.]|nr:hypothetical protein [Roseivirga sp.]